MRERADWVALGAGRIAHGSGRKVVVESGRGSEAVHRTVDPGFAVADAAFVGRRLFLAGEDRLLREVGSEPPFDVVGVLPLSPAPTGALHLVAMDSWLVVAEEGTGLRFLPIASPYACHPAPAVGPFFFPLPESFRGLAAVNRTVHAAVADGRILEIDAADPSLPVVRRTIPHDGAILALAASRTRLYLLGEPGLELLELGTGGAPRSEVHPEVRGRSLQLVGRTLRIAGGEAGLATFRDLSSAAQVYDVSANDDYFSPEFLPVALGDTVRWSNVTGNLHNVVSCSPAQIGCGGSQATESFTSGPATEFWVLDHTFAEAGSNPYVCQPHAGFMSGNVTVTGSAGAPPGVPDGRTGAPVRVGKLVPDGSTLSVAWDTTTCSGAAEHQILYGYAFGLPGSTGNGYELGGARCSIGVASPFTWTGVPAAFAGSAGFLFWFVVATDGAATEGSWGKDGAGRERQGPGAGGASGECGIVVKSLANSCPP